MAGAIPSASAFTTLDEEGPEVIADIYNELNTSINTLSGITETFHPSLLGSASRRFLEGLGFYGDLYPGVAEPASLVLQRSLVMLRVVAELLGFNWSDILLIATDRKNRGVSHLPEPITAPPKPVDPVAVLGGSLTISGGANMVFPPSSTMSGGSITLSNGSAAVLVSVSTGTGVTFYNLPFPLTGPGSVLVSIDDQGAVSIQPQQAPAPAPKPLKRRGSGGPPT
jgi:hypothetical protein